MSDAPSNTIKRFRLTDEYFFHEGCHIVEVSNSDDDDISIVRARVEPGETTRWHKLTATTERYVILDGRGSVQIGNAAAVSVDKGDVVIIPANTPQRIRNTGNEDLLFLAICSPRFSLANYHQL